MLNRIRELRVERGWSQVELAGRVDVSRQTIIAIEAGRHDPSLTLGFQIAREFGVTMEELFYD